MISGSLWSVPLIEELSHWATLWPVIHKPRMHSEITISIPKRKLTLFSVQIHGVPLFFFQTDTVTSQIKAHVTAEPTMGGIDSLNKDTSVWWCATQLSSQVGRDNGTRAACPCRTCDVTEDIRGRKLTTTQHKSLEWHPKSFHIQTRSQDEISRAAICFPRCGSVSVW